MVLNRLYFQFHIADGNIIIISSNVLVVANKTVPMTHIVVIVICSHIIRAINPFNTHISSNFYYLRDKSCAKNSGCKNKSNDLFLLNTKVYDKMNEFHSKNI